MLDKTLALPDDVTSLQAMVRALFAERDLAFDALKLKTVELEKMKAQLAKLRRLNMVPSDLASDRQAAAHAVARMYAKIGQVPAALVWARAQRDPAIKNEAITGILAVLYNPPTAAGARTARG